MTFITEDTTQCKEKKEEIDKNGDTGERKEEFCRTGEI